MPSRLIERLKKLEALIRHKKHPKFLWDEADWAALSPEEQAEIEASARAEGSRILIWDLEVPAIPECAPDYVPVQPEQADVGVPDWVGKTLPPGGVDG